MKHLSIVFILAVLLFACKEKAETPVLIPGMDNLFLMSNAETRSISPENLTGEKGQGGRIAAGEGNAKRAAKKHGWKANPYVFIEAGEEKVLADIKGSGIVNHIWMTPGRDGRWIGRKWVGSRGAGTSGKRPGCVWSVRRARTPTPTRRRSRCFSRT